MTQIVYINVFVQDCGIASALEMEIPQSYIEP